jgi:hypothetical protein
LDLSYQAGEPSRKPPETQDFKLNFDRTSKGNSCRYGSRREIRYRNGNMRTFFSIYNVIATINQAERIAMVEGIKLAKVTQYFLN